MHLHWQNLNDKPGNRQGPGWIHGRSWLRLWGEANPGGGPEIKCEWLFFKFSFGVSLSAHRGDGVGVQLSFSIPFLLTFYLTLDGGLFARLARHLLPKEGYDDRETSLKIHDWTILWNVWTDPDSWSSKTPKWRDGNWHPLDTLLGKTAYSSRPLSTHAVMVPLPERPYQAKVDLSEDTWKRPRWFARRLVRADVDCKADPIPHPGKGENSWDCGEDATYGFGCVADTPERAIGKLVESVLRNRRRHGGSVMWKPALKQSAEEMTEVTEDDLFGRPVR